jgi:hypothetical protein
MAAFWREAGARPTKNRTETMEHYSLRTSEIFGRGERLRHFFGRTLNAVHCQVWTALCSYLLVAIARKEVRTERSLYEMLQIVGGSAFEQVPLAELVVKTSVKPINAEMQMSLLLNDF